MAELIQRYHQPVAEVVGALPELVDGRRRKVIEQRRGELEAAGVPGETALWAAGLPELSAALDLIDVALEAESPVLDTAQIYFSIGSDLEMDWLLECVLALPGQDRWHAGARSNLRDELGEMKSQLCSAVLANAMVDTSAKSKLEAWRHQHHVPLERYRRLFADLRSQKKVGMAMLSVALWEVKRLVSATGSKPQD